MYVYNAIDYIYRSYNYSLDVIGKVMSIVLYKRREPPRITYLRCFSCHTDKVITPMGSPNSLKTKYCQSCYNIVMQKIMDSIIDAVAS
jgi:hypothetical protein